VAAGFTSPPHVTGAFDGSRRVFVVEQAGTIRVVHDGSVAAEPFLDIRGRVESGGERGLLSVAFHPRFADNGWFYVNYTARIAGKLTTHVSRFSAAKRGAADPGSELVLLSIEQPYSNHNGGQIAFGPDGYLYVGMGDGGSSNDPHNHAQNLNSLLGKMLRIDVDRAQPPRAYSIPPGNPFAGRPDARPEIWAYGLRNPWRFSFDRATGELWIGDVGQGAWEEIDVVDPRRGGGMHFGWKTMEGRHCFDPPRGCDPAGLELPVHEYGHELGCSVTGGYVYRGRRIAGLAGAYLFADFCRGTVWSLVREPEGRARVATLLETRAMVSSFGEDEAGELYLCDHRDGAVLALEPGAS
jgi:glucose/arabinose dehydrogenase